MSREFRALQRSHCLDSGRAIMGFSQITVITLVVVIRGSFLGSQKASVSFTDVPGCLQWLKPIIDTGRMLSLLLLIKKENVQKMQAYD